MMRDGPFVIGLTGSIGMGKSTTARMFGDLRIPVWDADQAVARLYARGGGAVGPISQIFAAGVLDGSVSKKKLRDWIAIDKAALPRIEAIVHPLVAADRAEFLRDSDADIVILDIPLLFETGGDGAVDMVVAVSAAPDIQRARVLQRSGMTGEQFDLILSKQLPDAENRERADRVIITESLADARADVQNLVAEIRGKLAHA